MRFHKDLKPAAASFSFIKDAICCAFVKGSRCEIEAILIEALKDSSVSKMTPTALKPLAQPSYLDHIQVFPFYFRFH